MKYSELIKKNIILIGHPNAGKTTVGKSLSKDLKLKFIDTDNEIVQLVHESIPNIYKNRGNTYFRNLESKIIKNIKTVGNVISLGGGSVLNKKNMDYLLPNSIIINLIRPITLIKIDPHRPVINNKVILSFIIKDRKLIYKKYSDISITNNKTINYCIKKIKEKIELYD